MPHFTISLSVACRKSLPSLHLQLSVCLPMALISAEQCRQLCGPQTGAPRQRPTSTLTVPLSIHRPRSDTGRALNQVPDSLVDTVSKRECSSSFSASSNKHCAIKKVLTQSHDFCLQAAIPSGEGGWLAGNRVLPTKVTVLHSDEEQDKI